MTPHMSGLCCHSNQTQAPSPGLHGERLVQELLVEVLLDVLDEDDGLALVIELRTTRSAHHLQNVCVENRP